MKLTKRDYNADSFGRNTRDRLLSKLLTLLLQRTPTAIVISNAHFADELSWKELNRILDMRVQVSMLLTMLSVHAKSDNVQNKSRLQAEPHGVVGMQVGDLGSKYLSDSHNLDGKGPVRGHDKGPSGGDNKKKLHNQTIRYASKTAARKMMTRSRCTVLDMPPLGYEEVYRILASTLAPMNMNLFDVRASSKGAQVVNAWGASRPHHITPEVVERVLQVSNGNAFWCKSIAEFIADRGVSDFMISVERAGEVADEMSPVLTTDSNVLISGHGASSYVGAGNSWYQISSPSNVNYGKIHGRSHEFSTGPLQHNPLCVLVFSRLDKLSSHLQVILKYASIIGEEFDNVTLFAILPETFSKDLEKSLELLLESSFILCCGCMGGDEGSKPSITFCFQNYLIRSALYDLTPPRLV